MDQGTSTILMLVVMIAIFYFMLIRPENKRKKQAQEMRESLKKGDVITTIGGIVGKIVAVNQDTIVIETSDDRVRMELTKWAVSTNGVQTGEAAQGGRKKKKGQEEAEKEEQPAAAEAPAAQDEPAAVEEAAAAEAPAEETQKQD